MSKHPRICVICVVSVVLSVGYLWAKATPAHAAVPKMLNYQGRLTDENDSLYDGTTVYMKFDIFDAASGGSELWSSDEDNGGGNETCGVEVTPSGGVFNIAIGNTALSWMADLDLDFNAAAYYLEIKIQESAFCPGAEGDYETLDPRQRVLSSGYSINADTVDGLDSGSFLRSDAADVFNEDGADIDLRFEGDTDANLFFLDASTDYIGIGTVTPAQKLHVEGQCVTGDTLLPIAKSQISNLKSQNQNLNVKSEESDKRFKDLRCGSNICDLTFDIEYKQIKDIKGGDYVLSLDEETGKIVPAKIKGLLDMGVQPVFRLTTEDGRTIRTTGNHPYLTRDGWKKVVYLKVGQEIAVASQQKTTPSSGSLADNYTDVVVPDLSKHNLSQEKGFVKSQFEANKGVDLGGVEPPLPDLTGQVPHRRRPTPSLLFQKETTNTSASWTKVDHQKTPLSGDLVHLTSLLNGWIDTLEDKVSQEEKFVKPQFSKGVDSPGVAPVPEQSSVRGTLNRASLWFMGKPVDPSSEPARPTPDSLSQNKNPLSTSFEPSTSNYTVNRTEGSGSRYTVNRTEGSGSRYTVNRTEGSGSRLQPYVGWDTISSIEYVGEEQVYDISVEGTQNFIGNGIVAHNTYISGNLGIGTTGPNAKLEVVGQCVTGDSILQQVEEISNLKSQISKPQLKTQNLQVKDVRGGEYILSLDETTGQLVPAKINALLDMGWKETFELTTEDGKKIVTTGNHPYLTREGWQKVVYLKENQEIAAADLVFSPVQIDEEHKNNQEGPGDISNVHNLLPFSQQDKTNNRNTNQNKENVNLVENFTDIDHFSPFFTNLTEIIKSVKEAKPPKVASPNVGRIAEGKTLGKKYPPTVDKMAAFDKSSQYRERSLYWEETNFNFINTNDNTKTTGNVKRAKRSPVPTEGLVLGWVKIASIKPAGIRHVWDLSIEGTHNFVANGIVAHNTYITDDLYVGSMTEGITNASFALDGDDAYIHDLLGVGDDLYVEDTVVVGSSTTISSSDINFSGNATLTLGGNLKIGTNALYVSGTSGNIGIGTTSPLNKLDVSGAVAIGSLPTSALPQSNMLYVSGNVGIGTTGPGAKLTVDSGKIQMSESGVAHGITDYVPTNVFASFEEHATGTGGFTFRGLTDADDHPLFFIGISGAASPTVPTLTFRGGKKDGTAYSAIADSEQLISFDNFTTQKVVILGSGNVGIGTTGPDNLLSLNEASGDVLLDFDLGDADKWVIGLDDSDGDYFKINSGNTLADTSDLELQDDGDLLIGGDFTVGLSAADDDDYIYFDDGSTEYLAWFDGASEFAVSDDFNIHGNLNLAAATNLIFGGTTSLGETTGPTDSGAYLVGANDEFDNSSEVNVQGVLDDLDQHIEDLEVGGTGLWYDSGSHIYPSDAGDYGGTGMRIEDDGDIWTDGDLYVDDDFTVGLAASDDDDYLYFDDGSTEYIKWDDGNGEFLVSDDFSIDGDLEVIGADITLHTAGVKLTGDGDGAITFLGLGDGTDEDLTINLDDTADQVVFSSSTGVTTVDFGTLDLGTDALDVSDGNITNVGDIALDTISSDAGLAVTVSLGGGAGDDFIVDTDVLVVESDNNRVGIGTTAPGAKLDVAGNIALNDGNYIYLYNGTDANWRFGKNATTHDIEIHGAATAENRAFIVYGGASGTTEKFRVNLNTNGNVGIGTTGPQGILDIASAEPLVYFNETDQTDPAGDFRFGVSGDSFYIQGRNAADNAYLNHMIIARSGSIYLNAAQGSGDIVLQTGGTNKVTLQSDGDLIVNAGNVGIGTTGPIGRLDVQGATARTGTAPTTPSFYVTGTLGSGQTGPAAGNIEFRHDNQTQGIGFGYNTIYQTGSNTNQELNLLSRGSSPITLNAYPYSTGNVGIGTTSPGSKLSVSGDISLSGLFHIGPVIRFSRTTAAYNATNATKDSACTTDLGSNYQAASVADVAAYSSGAEHDPHQHFVVAGNTSYRFIVSGTSQTAVVEDNATGTESVACIRKDAPLRFSRTTAAYNATNAVKDSACTTDLGSNYQAASAADVAAYISGADYNSRQFFVVAGNTTYRFRIGDIVGYGCPMVEESGTGTESVACIRKGTQVGADVAEFIPTKETNLQAGDILSIDPKNNVMAEKSRTPYDPKLLGIVPTEPGLLIGNETIGQENTMLALTGRVPAKATTKNGHIRPGDPITSSDLVGAGMKATHAGPIIGKALESTEGWNEGHCPQVPSLDEIDWPQNDGKNSNGGCYRLPDGTYVGRIMVFINIGWFDTTATKLAVNENGDITISGNVGIGTANPVQKLHVEGQCITGDSLLYTVPTDNNAGQEAQGSTHSTGSGLMLSKVEASRLKAQNIQIKDIKSGTKVYSYNEETKEIEPHSVVALLDMGVKPVFKLKTESGKEIRTTGNHPYLVQLTNDELNSRVQLRETGSLEREYGLGQGSLSAASEFSETREVWTDIAQQKTAFADGLLTGKHSDLVVPAPSDDNISQQNNLVKPQFQSKSVEVEGVEPSLPALTELAPRRSTPTPFSLSQKETGDTRWTNIEASPQVHSSPITDHRWVKVIYLQPGDSIATASFREPRTVNSQPLAAGEYLCELSTVNCEPYVVWDKIQSIEYVGEEQVYDIEVEGTHNFVANGIVAHNTYISGEVGIGTTGPDHDLEIGTGTYSEIDAGEAQFTTGSSRDYKENINPIFVDKILEKIANVPVNTYDFREEYCDGGNAKCKDKLGLISEDFYTVFGRGDDKSIRGQEVQMALWLGVQELAKRTEGLKEQQGEIEALEQLADADNTDILAWLKERLASVAGSVRVFQNVVAGRIITPLLESRKVVAKLALLEETKTDIISPLTDGKLVIRMNANDNSANESEFGGMLEIQNKEGEPVVTVDGFGNLTASGSGTFRELTAYEIIRSRAVETEIINSEWLMVNEATVSGDLTVGEPTINNSQLTVHGQVAANEITAYEIIRARKIVTEGIEAEHATFTETLQALGSTSLVATTIAGPLSQDGTLLFTEGKNIDVVGDTLHLQSEGLGAIDFIAGAMKLDEEGNLVVSGQLTVAKGLFTDKIAPASGEKLVLEGDVEATGSARFGDLIEAERASFGSLLAKTVNSEKITAESISTKDLILEGKIRFSTEGPDRSAGVETILAGTRAAVVSTSLIEEDSYVFLTSQSSTAQTLYVEEKVPGAYFVVSLDEPVTTDLEFAWLLLD